LIVECGVVLPPSISDWPMGQCGAWRGGREDVEDEGGSRGGESFAWGRIGGPWQIFSSSLSTRLGMV
jgi:hypothetical protein